MLENVQMSNSIQLQEKSPNIFISHSLPLVQPSTDGISFIFQVISRFFSAQFLKNMLYIFEIRLARQSDEVDTPIKYQHRRHSHFFEANDNSETSKRNGRSRQ